MEEERAGGKKKEYRRACGRKEGEGREKRVRNGSVEKCHRAILIYNGREIGAANFVSVAETQKFLLVGIGTFIDVRGRFLARARKIKKGGEERKEWEEERRAREEEARFEEDWSTRKRWMERNRGRII